ncbi:hypothetical protein BKA65DRAFT_516622 [Rhexocercosporidium sp. MPI-PUGE-AT-0058]|nr:hypothetical protein BKA65DRAFT_516622 [Rhexocercosporidium sp. MPI-PUGE-AT-0058]
MLPTYNFGAPHLTSATEVDASSQEQEINPMLQDRHSSDSDCNQTKSEPYSNKNTTHQPQKFDSLRNWKWELLSLVGMTMSLVAIILLLNHYDGKPSPLWPYEITLNTLVSIFSTLLKALMMMAVAECISQLKWIWFKSPRSLADLTTFEEASRGPWGSTQLLFTLRFHHLAALGALVTIVTIAVDPFVQQAMRFYSCSYIETNSLASIPVAHSYAPQQDLLAPLEVGMVGAIYDGLLNLSFNGSTVTSKCPTGNCTFPTKYTTFGICSSCTNLAYDIQNEFMNVSYIKNDVAAPRIILNSTLLGSNDPQNINVWSELSMIQPPFDANVMNPPTLIVGPTSQYPNFTRFPQSTPYNDTGFYIAGFTSISYTRNSSCTSDWMVGGERRPETDCVVPARLPGAREKVTTCQASPMDSDACVTIDDFDSIIASACGLSFCGKTYEGVVRDGVFEERLVGESNATEIAEPGYDFRHNHPPSNVVYLAYVLSPCWHNNTEYKNVYEYLEFNMTEALWNYKLDSSDASLAERLASGNGPLNYTYMETKVALDPQKKGVFDACVINATPLAYSNLDLYLRRFLKGNVTGLHMDRGASDSRPNPGKNWAATANVYTTEWLNPMYANGLASQETMQALFSRLAASMTNHMRTSDVNGTTVLGEVNGVQTCVRVVWPWLALPAALVLSTCLLLVATILKTAAQANANVWKSSPLAYLFHGMKEQGRADVRGSLITVDEMDEIAKRKDVVLSETSEGWRFVAEPRGH